MYNSIKEQFTVLLKNRKEEIKYYDFLKRPKDKVDIYYHSRYFFSINYIEDPGKWKTYKTKLLNAYLTPSKLNQIFDKVFLINLDKRKDRFERMDKLLKSYRIEYERISAIPGLHSSNMSDGAYGCLLSHLKVIKLAKENKYNKVLILEDDLIFHYDFKFDNIPSNFSLLYLGASQKPNTIDFRKVNKLYRANQSRGTFAYGIDHGIYDFVINLLETKEAPVDLLLEKAQQKYLSYVLWDNLIISNVSESNTQKSRNMIEYSKKVGWKIENYDYNYQYDLDDCTILVKTFDRVSSLKRMISSVRLYYPNIKIIVCDDGKENIKNIENIEIYKTEFDIGLSAGRNLMFNMVKTKYAIVCDDDFVFTSETKLETFYHIITNYDIDLIGGILRNQPDHELVRYNHCFNVIHGKDYKTLLYQDKCIKSCSLFEYYDLVLNFFMVKTEKILEIKWDNNLKLGEHTDFFYRAKEHKLKVGQTEKVIVDHYPERTDDYKKYRMRGKGYFMYFMDKFKFTHIIDVHGNKMKLNSGILENVIVDENKNHTIHKYPLGNTLYLNSDYFPRSRINLIDLIDNIKTFNLIFDKHKSRYWMTDGTLLGWYRDNGIVSWDKDVDFAVFNKEWNEKIFWDLIDLGWEIFGVYGRKKYKQYTIIRNKVKTDIFVFYNAKEYVWHTAWKKSKEIKDQYNVIQYRYTKPYNLRQVCYFGQRMYVPENIESVLTQKYGNWKEPERKWDWQYGPVNSHRTHYFETFDPAVYQKS